MDELSTYYLSQGVLGATVLVLSFVIVKLYKKTNELEKDKTDLLIARNVDDKATIKEVTSVLQTTAQNIAILAEKIEAGKRTTK